MANDNKYTLPCHVVLDLLPQYIEGLTSKDTDNMIQAHLDTCADCMAAYEAMKEPATPEEVAPLAISAKKDDAPVQYLKKVKRKSRDALLSVIAAVLVVALGVGGYLGLVKVYPVDTRSFSHSSRYNAVYLMDGSLCIFMLVTPPTCDIKKIDIETIYFDKDKKEITENLQNAVAVEFRLGYRYINKGKPAYDYTEDTENIRASVGYYVIRLPNITSVYVRGQGKNLRRQIWQKIDFIHADIIQSSDSWLDSFVQEHGDFYITPFDSSYNNELSEKYFELINYYFTKDFEKLYDTPVTIDFAW